VLRSLSGAAYSLRRASESVTLPWRFNAHRRAVLNSPAGRRRRFRVIFPARWLHALLRDGGEGRGLCWTRRAGVILFWIRACGMCCLSGLAALAALGSGTALHFLLSARHIAFTSYFFRHFTTAFLWRRRC